jgi:hypothetical protein
MTALHVFGVWVKVLPPTVFKDYKACPFTDFASLPKHEKIGTAF